jgi:PAS domain S-box-containing protein
MAKSLKILLLEDSTTDAEMVQRSLRKDYNDATFHVAMTENNFVESLDAFKPDVILADNSMPQFNATEALRIIRQRKLHVPFIMVTGTMSEEFAVNIIKSGADDYILKDSLLRLPAAIDAALRRRWSEQQRGQALQQLVQSEEKYRSLVERVSDGFIALDPDWKVVYANKIAENLLGYSEAYLTGRNLWSVFPESINNPFYLAYHRALQSQQQVEIEEYSDSTKKWIEARCYPSSSGVSIFFRDVTAQRETELEAKRSEENYRKFLERINDAFIALDRKGELTFMNTQAIALSGRQQESMIGKNIWDIYPESVGSATYHAINQAMKDQQYVTNIDYYQPLDLWIENYIYPSQDGLSIFIRNITEKKKLEIKLNERIRREQLNLTASALEAQEKERNAIGQELHDNVNQILVGTNLLLTIARDNPEKAAELLTTSLENIRAAIDENRKIAHELVTPDLTQESILQQIYRITKSMLASAGIQVKINHDQFTEYLLTDDQKLTLYRITQEHCTNIIKYAKAKSVLFELVTLNGQCLATISDDGVGMPEAKVSSGIGLRNIKGRMSVLNGSVKIDTAEGQGFKLHIQFPLAQHIEDDHTYVNRKAD